MKINSLSDLQIKRLKEGDALANNKYNGFIQKIIIRKGVIWGTTYFFTIIGPGFLGTKQITKTI